MRSARFQINIEADSPVIMFPHSYKTTDLLVAELGQLKVTNRFLLDGSAGTIKARQKKTVDLSGEGSGYTDQFERQTSGSDYIPMTQSVFDQSCPSQSAPASVDVEVDPMNQSIYGSLDHDIREGELVAPSMTESKSSEIFDPTENISADSSILLAPLECVSPGNFSVLDNRFQLEHSRDTLSPTMGTKLSKKLSAPLLAQEKKMLNPFQLSVQQSMAFSRHDPSTHICLLDVMSVTLTDMDFYSAELRKTSSGPDGPIYSLEREVILFFFTLKCKWRCLHCWATYIIKWWSLGILTSLCHFKKILWN